MTQKQEVLAMLKSGPVCSTDLLKAFIPRGAARINDLRNEGWMIETRRCQHPGHKHQTRQVEYVMLSRSPIARGSR